MLGGVVCGNPDVNCWSRQATVLDTRQEVVVKVVWPDADLDPEDAKNESPGQHRKDAFKREM